MKKFISFLFFFAFYQDLMAATLISNQALDGFPGSQYDLYVPKKVNRIIVFLHGGGGTKEGIAYDLDLKTNGEKNDYIMSESGQAWIDNTKTLMVFPQGLSVVAPSPLKATPYTWDNYVMRSGRDDMAFLKALSAKLLSQYSTTTKIYLGGHSNGGMMVNRMMCESSPTFKGYVSIAGPESKELGTSGLYPCQLNNQKVKPYLTIFGSNDLVLATNNKISDSLWTINPILTTNDDVWASKQVVNEKNNFINKVFLRCGEQLASPEISGDVETYSNCFPSMKMLIFNQNSATKTGGDHCIKNVVTPCKSTLVGNTGVDLKQMILDFFMSLN